MSGFTLSNSLPHIMFKGRTIKIPIINKSRNNFTIPDNLVKLYIELLVYKRKVISVKKGVIFYKVILNKWPSKGEKPIILGNIFD